MSEQQRTFPFFGVLPDEIQAVDPVAVAGCSHWAQALRLCIKEARVTRTDRQWAKALGMAVGTWNTLKNTDHHEKNGSRQRNLNPDLIPLIEALAHNRAISQYLGMKSSGQLFCQRRAMTKEEQLAQLRAQVAEVEKELLEQRGDSQAVA